MNALLTRYHALPRAGKWLAWLCGFLALFFGLINPALSRASEWGSSAEKIESALADRAGKKSLIENSAADLDRSMLAYGTPAMPQKRRDPTADLDARVRQVLRAHGVTPKRSTSKGPEPFQRPSKTADGRTIKSDGPKLDRYAIELSFECDTTRLLGVMRDLERAAEISALSKVIVRRIVESNSRGGKNDVSMLSVTLVPEMWVIAPTAAGAAPVKAPETRP
ncbi:MAG: hypothetical protein ACREJO_16490 [Phycisphaerales bacterium]